jgi:phospholipid/cholesterol/gamma-HCH transport system substrate-binding protein
MRHSTQDLMVGLCSIGALAGLSALLLRFGELAPLLERSYAVTLRTNTAMSIRVGSQVMLEGVPVGEVSAIALDPGADLPVVMQLRVNEKFPVPASVKPTVSAGLLGGGSKIDLKIPAGAPRDLIDPDQPPVLEARFASITDQIEAILAQVNSGQGTVGRLMNDPKLYDEMTEAAQRLTITLRDLQALVRRVKEEGLELKF